MLNEWGLGYPSITFSQHDLDYLTVYLEQSSASFILNLDSEH